jgi:hypothetical protein
MLLWKFYQIDHRLNYSLFDGMISSEKNKINKGFHFEQSFNWNVPLKTTDFNCGIIYASPSSVSKL